MSRGACLCGATEAVRSERYAARFQRIVKVEHGALVATNRQLLDHLDARAVADDGVTLFHRADTVDVEAHRGVELERRAACGRQVGAVGDADLLPGLVAEPKTRQIALSP